MGSHSILVFLFVAFVFSLVFSAKPFVYFCELFIYNREEIIINSATKKY